MTLRRRVVVIAFAAMAASSLLVASSPASVWTRGIPTTAGRKAADPIRIAVMADRTAGLAFFGQRAQQGWDIAKKSIGSTVAGRLVTYINVQCSTPADCAADTDRVIHEQKATVIMGTPGSALALAISQAAARNNVPYFETAALANQLLPKGDAQFIFRAAPDETTFQRGVKLAILGWSKKTKTPASSIRAVLVNESSAANHNAGVIQKSVMKIMGINVVDQFEYTAKSSDFASLAARIANDKPDLLIETSYLTDSLSLNTELAQRNFNPKLHIIAGAPSPPDQLKALGALYLEGIVQVTYPALDLSEKGAHGIKLFSRLYEGTFGSPPDSPYALTYFSSARILFDVLKLSGGNTSPDAFKKAILAIDKPVGSYANGWGAKFNKHGQNTRSIAMVVQWQKGAICTVLPLASASCRLRFG
jgi:ABC-type branched-subunit amino acid transport system substrate-binding protein